MQKHCEFIVISYKYSNFSKTHGASDLKPLLRSGLKSDAS